MISIKKFPFLSKHSFVATVLLFLLLVFTANLQAQDEDRTWWVGLRILDNQGNPAPGVTPDSLKLQSSHVDKPISDLVPQQNRQFVIVIDMAFNSLPAVLSVRQAVWEFLNSLPRGDVAAIAVFHPTEFIRLQCSLTSDRNQWAYALNHLDVAPQATDAAGFYLPADPRQPWQETPADSKDVEAQLSKSVGNLDKAAVKKLTGVFSGKLGEFAKNLNVVRGEKQVVLFSPGVPSESGSEKGIPEDRDLGMPAGDDSEIELESSAGSAEGGNQWLADAFSGSNCVVNTIDTSSLGKPLSTGKDFLRDLAKRSKGIYDRDLTLGISRIKAIPGQTYLLSWRAPQGLPRFEEIKVTSSQDLDIVAPRQVLSPKAVSQLDPVERKLYYAQWLYAEDTIVEGLQHVEFVDSFPLEKNFAKTVFFLQIPGEQLLALKSKARSIVILGYVFDTDGKLVDFIYTPIHVDTGKTSEVLKKTGIRFFDTFLTPGGSYRFHGAIVDVEASQPSPFSFPFTVPDFQGLAITRPIIPSSSQDWIMLRHEYQDEKKRGVDVSYPYEIKGSKEKDLVFFPDFAPELQNGSSCFLYYRVYGLAVDSTNEPDPRIRFALQSGAGQKQEFQAAVQGAADEGNTWSIVSRNLAAANEFALLFQLNVKNAAPGKYRLVTDFGDGIAQKLASRSIAVSVR